MEDYVAYSKDQEQQLEEEIAADNDGAFSAMEEAVEDTYRRSKVGVVTDCVKLYVRNNPSSDAVTVGVINCLSEVIVDEEESTEDFYKVCTASGLDGFCMKKFIAVEEI